MTHSPPSGHKLKKNKNKKQVDQFWVFGFYLWLLDVTMAVLSLMSCDCKSKDDLDTVLLFHQACMWGQMSPSSHGELCFYFRSVCSKHSVQPGYHALSSPSDLRKASANDRFSFLLYLSLSELASTKWKWSSRVYGWPLIMNLVTLW